jgi:hypothetical protein
MKLDVFGSDDRTPIPENHFWIDTTFDSSHEEVNMKTNRVTRLADLNFFIAALLLTTLALAGHPSPAGALEGADAHFTVNDPADPGQAACLPEQCSLRAAIAAANTESMAGEHTVSFDLTYPVTITLSSPLPVISGTLTINGPGADNLTISGGGQHLVLTVGNNAVLSLQSVAIRAGYNLFAGAGILNDHGNLTIQDSLIANNLNGGGDGGGLYNDGGQVDILNTVFLENDAFHHGAISNHGVMTVTETIFQDNSARIGGAIFNDGQLTIQGSTFSGNIATQIGGGAIENADTLVVVNSTFAYNGSTFGADILNGGNLQITNSTFYSATLPSLDSLHNGLGVTMTLSNTIVAAGSGIENCGGDGAVQAVADTFATDATCAGATVVSLDQLRLGTLQNNGGPTPTIALRPGSLAIDSAIDAVCAAPSGPPFYGAGGVDQRGVLRPQGEHCDVGAFEQTLVHHIYLPLILNLMQAP